MSRVTERHLDPGSRFGEILFSLIMALTVTLAAGSILLKGERCSSAFACGHRRI
jgi:hypothetical protein